MSRKYYLSISILVFALFPVALKAPASKVKRLHQPKVKIASGADTKLTNPDKQNLKQEKLIAFAKDLIGTAYVWGGSSINGFDCSGFTAFVFKNFDVKLPRTSTLQANAGVKKELKEARRGDLLIFTGTNPKVRKPGHVGIVISKPGEPIKFVHASSVGGVKISKITDGSYTRRFMEVRRLL